ncbi:MAG: hypothetical protein H7141_00740 [Burkholderiales bacterium]|nr:hypothetical protein [Bacteroidia bacterium]
MKKITLLAAVILVASFASCKKVRNCKCTYSDGSTITVSSGVKLSKKDGKTWCEGSTSGYSGMSCQLQ